VSWWRNFVKGWLRLEMVDAMTLMVLWALFNLVVGTTLWALSISAPEPHRAKLHSPGEPVAGEPDLHHTDLVVLEDVRSQEYVLTLDRKELARIPYAVVFEAGSRRDAVTLDLVCDSDGVYRVKRP